MAYPVVILSNVESLVNKSKNAVYIPLFLMIFPAVFGSAFAAEPDQWFFGLLSDVPDIESSVTIDDITPYASCYTPDMKYQISGSRDNDSKLWFQDVSKVSPKDQNESVFSYMLPSSSSIVKICGNGSLIAAGGCWGSEPYASNIYIFNFTSREVENQIAVSHQYFEPSPDGRYIAVINNRSYGGIYWTANGSLFKQFDSDFALLAFSPDGDYVAAANIHNLGFIEVLKFPEMTSVFKIDGKPNFTLSPNRVGVLSWSGDRQYLAVVDSAENKLRILSTNNWTVIRNFTSGYRNFHYNFISFSPGCTWLAAGGSTVEARGVSLGLQIYNTANWESVHNEYRQLDYDQYFESNNQNNDRYAIYNSMGWFNENWLSLSVSMYKGSIVLFTEADFADRPDIPEQREINYMPVLAASIAVVVILSFLGTLSYLGYLPNPLYSKLKREELKNQQTRNHILSYVHSHPGCNFSDIRKTVGVSDSNLYYHISVLEREDLIFSKESGSKRLFYTSDFPKFSKLFADISEKGIHERIYLLLLTNPGLTQKDIAKKLQISEATVSRYMLDLLTDDFIKREKDGKVWRCYANVEADAQV